MVFVPFLGDLFSINEFWGISLKSPLVFVPFLEDLFSIVTRNL